MEVLTEEGRRLWRNSVDGDAGEAVRWSPGGLRLASGHPHKVIVWDASTGEIVQQWRTKGVADSLSWTADSERLASSGMVTYLLDARTGQIVAEMPLVSDAVAVSPQGSKIALVTDEALSIYSTQPQERLLTVSENQGLNYWILAGWMNLEKLACATSEGVIQIWDMSRKLCTATLLGHSDGLTSLHAAMEGALLASSSHDGTIRIWSPAMGKELACLRAHTGAILAVALSPDASRLASASTDESVRIWDVSALRPDHVSENRSPSFEAYLARQAATVGRRARVRVLDLWVPDVRSYKDQGAVTHGVAILLDGTSAILACDDGAVRRVDLRTGSEVWRSQEKHQSSTNDISLSFDGHLAASSGRDGSVMILDPARGELLTRRFIGGVVSSSSFSPEGTRIASAQVRAPYSIKIWTLRTPQSELELTGHESEVSGVDWHPGGRLIASASTDKSLRIWDAMSGTELDRLVYSENLWAVRWSPDGSLLAAAGADGTVAIWNFERKQLVETLSGHTDGVQHIAWSPDGRFIASGGNDSTVRVWDPRGGREVHRFDFQEDYAWRLSWSPNGAFLAASLANGIIRIFDVREIVSPGAIHRPSAAPPVPLIPDLEPLPVALAFLARLGLATPLAHLRDLHRLLAGAAAGDETLRPLVAHAGVQRLAELHWPVAARTGLMTLLLRTLPPEPEWRPPPGTSPTELRRALAEALTGEPMTPAAPPLPVAAIGQAAEAIDERLMTLLELVGHEAVAADPALPLRLLSQAPRLPAVAVAQRQLLGMRLRLDQGGQAQGSGPGGERTGIDLRGDLRSVLPSQLALPDEVLRLRQLYGGLLYRARVGREPPRLRPTVLLLDVSPPTFGPVEAVTRLAAHAIASSLIEAGLPGLLLTTGGAGSLQLLERARDLVEIWVRRSLEPADEAAALGAARALRETLAGDSLEPIVVVLSHVHFGAEAAAPSIPGLRGLFVDYPGRRARPNLAGACERWTSLAPGETGRLSAQLAELVA